jgi:hypothetical protein
MGEAKIDLTGDIIWINKKYHHLFENLNMVITDGSFISKGGMIKKDSKTGKLCGHAGIPDLIKLFKPFTRHILFIHFDSWFYKGTNKARAKLNEPDRMSGISMLIGYNNMQIDLVKWSKI